MLISIIIPVYCAEKHLKRCVDSVLQQTCTCYEIILINDESTDNSLLLCKELENKHPNIRVITQKHSGVSKARNVGIAASTGDWLMFIDADDELEKNAIQNLKVAIDITTDAVCGKIIRGKGKWQSRCLKPKALIQLSGTELMNAVLTAPTDYLTTHGWLLRKRIVEAHGICFDCRLTLGEDSLMMLQFLKHCKQATFIPEEVYLYTISSHSTIHCWKPYRFEAYQDMLKATQAFNEFEQWPVFVLTTYLLILMYDVFHQKNHQSFQNRFKTARHLRSTTLFSVPLAKVNWTTVPWKTRVVFIWIKKDWLEIVWIAIKLRQLQNYLRA